MFYLYKKKNFTNSIPNNEDEKQSDDDDDAVDKHSLYAYNSSLVELFSMEQDFQMMMEIENNYRLLENYSFVGNECFVFLWIQMLSRLHAFSYVYVELKE